MNIIDLFCGCGGFSLGAHRAGFESLVAVDIDATLSSSFVANFPNTTVWNRDLREVTIEDFLEIIGDKHLHGIIGGPPCQGFSTIGKREKTDPRNNLVNEYFKIIKSLSPDFFVMENVPGILTGGNKTILEEAVKLVAKRYNIWGPTILNAADYGAPTSRKRVIVIGTKKGLPEFQLPESTGKVTVSDAFLGLVDPITDSNDKFDWVKCGTADSEYIKRLNRMIPTVGYEPALKQFAKSKVSGFQSTKHSDHVAARYASLRAGEMDKVSKSIKLNLEGQAPTLRAGTGSDKGSFQAVRPIHPTKARVISVREAARIQGFPDWFVFHPTKWHSFRMIGNSVSPVFSEMLMQQITGLLGYDSALKKCG